jgi:hypothetical protein
VIKYFKAKRIPDVTAINCSLHGLIAILSLEGNSQVEFKFRPLKRSLKGQSHEKVGEIRA